MGCIIFRHKYLFFKKNIKKIDKVLDKGKKKEYIWHPLLIVAKMFIDIGKKEVLIGIKEVYRSYEQHKK